MQKWIGLSSSSAGSVRLPSVLQPSGYGSDKNRRTQVDRANGGCPGGSLHGHRRPIDRPPMSSQGRIWLRMPLCLALSRASSWGRRGTDWAKERIIRRRHSIQGCSWRHIYFRRMLTAACDRLWVAVEGGGTISGRPLATCKRASLLVSMFLAKPPPMRPQGYRSFS